MKFKVQATPPGVSSMSEIAKDYGANDFDFIIWFIEKDIFVRKANGPWLPWVKGESIKQSLGI